MHMQRVACSLAARIGLAGLTLSEGKGLCAEVGRAV